MLCITQTTPLFFPYFHQIWQTETTGKLTNKLFSPNLSALALLPKSHYADALNLIFNLWLNSINQISLVSEASCV